MNTFEEHLQNAAKSPRSGMLGGLGIVLDANGVVYEHFAGQTRLDTNALPIDESTTLYMASAGKIITYLATLQLVEAGKIGLDDSVFGVLPELSTLPIILPSSQPGETTGFVLEQRQNTMTVRQMLTHSAGIADDEHPLIELWRRARSSSNTLPDTSSMPEFMSLPLLFEPGDSWRYGHSVHWLQFLITRLSGIRFPDYIRQHVFLPLGMESSSYLPRQDLSNRLLQAVERQDDGSLAPAGKGALNGLMCSIADVKLLLQELISPAPKLLSPDMMTILFQPAFAQNSPALKALRADTENYAAPAGLSPDMPEPPVNYGCGGLVVLDTLPVSNLPRGTVTWNGLPNVVWAVHREKGVALFFGTQLLPVDDPLTVSVMMEFFRGASAQYLAD